MARGFRSTEEQRRLASMGGRAAHEQGVAHEWSQAEAEKFGAAGGAAVSAKFSELDADGKRAYFRELGRRGGKKSQALKAERKQGGA